MSIQYVNEAHIEKWDKRFLDMSRMVASWSKEPRSRVGAVIVDYNRRIISCGYNGFPRGVVDSRDRLMIRDLKNAIAVHAETNAIVSSRQSVAGNTIYVSPLFPCSHCAGTIIQAGITRVVAHVGNNVSEDWKKSAEIAIEMFNEAKTEVIFVES